ncbi:PhoH family protein [Chlamydiifrater volucris]|uniref:PhoH family protein n=1 Tax=Chlamydiifrater volucris TaxID=2681470 RepID=UPI001BCAEE79|nr:PhoH family protein [Chlamydiifrater volucris]
MSKNRLKKVFVLDTSVLIYDPEAISSFEGCKVILPFTVLEELESVGKFRDESAKNASRALLNIRHLLENSSKNCSEGVCLDNGTFLSVAVLPQHETVKTSKLLVLDVLQMLVDKGEEFVYVTKSLGRRVRAESMGIESRDYENQRFAFRSLYRGFRRIDVDAGVVQVIYKDGEVDIPVDLDPSPNEYFLLQEGERSSVLARYDVSVSKLVSLKALPDSVWGIKPLNVEQKCALDLLLRDEVKLVTLIGQAGSGKTLLALAAAMHKVFDKGIYNKLLISRPIVPMGKDIGFLPGIKEDKLAHWMQPIYDNMEFLCHLNGMEDFGETLPSLISAKKIEMEALTYIRGRSLPKVFMIIDEAQNLTPHEIKTIVSRAGQGTKIILTGDPTQIDSPYFDENSNGLTYLVGKFRNLALYGHMFMARTERSELAAAAAKML